MGLLTVPKKYNPPGNGKRDMEYPIFATKQEMGLLKARGGSGKMTRHGIRSFGLGDKGNAVGSAGGSNYSGDGMGGQVNMDGVGMGGDKVLRQIDGRWTAVDRATGAQIDAGGSIGPVRVKPAPVQYTPAAAAPVQQTVTAPMSLGPNAGMINTLPQIGGTTAAAIASAIKSNAPDFAGPSSSMSTASPSPQIGGTVNTSAFNDKGRVSASPFSNSTPTLDPSAFRDTGRISASPFKSSPVSFPSDTGRISAAPYSSPKAPASIPTSNGPQTRGQMPNYGAGPAVDPGMANNASYFGDVSDFQGSAPAARAITSMLAEAQRRAASNRLQEQYSQYQSPPGSPMAPGGLDRYADMTTGGKFGAGSTQSGMTPEATPDRAFNVGVMDAPRLSADPTNGISAYPGAGVPNLPFVKDQSRIAQGIKEYDTYDRIAPVIKDQSRLAQAPSYVNRFAPPPSEVSADLYSRVDQLIGAMNRPRESEVGVPASMGPTYGPETPKGPEGWQQGDVSIDPTSSTPLDYAKEIAMNTPIARAATGIMNVLDRISGGPAYRDDVSLGTDESGRRTDRAPSGGGFSTSPGGFGPGGGDRRGGFRGGSHGKAPHPKTDDSTTPPPVTPPVTPPPVNTAQWYYPEYQSQWAGLPVGLGGTYGRA